MAVFAFFSAFAALFSYFIAPLSAKLSRFLGAIDLPDGVRKLHALPMPKLGGVGIYASFSVSMALLCLFDANCLGRFATVLLVGGGASVFVGAADDIFSFDAPKKLSLGGIISLCAALYMIDASDFAAPSFYIFRVFGNSIFILMLMNAYNMVDGVDGLCATLSLVPLIFAAENPAALLLFFSVLGFLPHNLPAEIYLGEAGAGVLGFLTASIILWGGTNTGSLAALLPFLTELVGTVLRRTASLRHPFSSGRGHIHHILLSLGFSTHGIAALLCITALLAACAFQI